MLGNGHHSLLKQLTFREKSMHYIPKILSAYSFEENIPMKDILVWGIHRFYKCIFSIHINLFINIWSLHISSKNASNGLLKNCRVTCSKKNSIVPIFIYYISTMIYESLYENLKLWPLIICFLYIEISKTDILHIFKEILNQNTF